MHVTTDRYFPFPLFMSIIFLKDSMSDVINHIVGVGEYNCF